MRLGRECEALATALDGATIAQSLDRATLVDVAIEQRVGPLLAETSFGRSLTGPAAQRLAEDQAHWVVQASLLNDEVRRVADAISAARIHALILKGAHVAHAVYPRPHLRVRSDTDLLIAPDSRQGIEKVLLESGYRRSMHVRGATILGQFHFEREHRSGLTVALDVHWRVGAPLLLERLLPARVLFESAVAIPALGAHARGPALEHALALSCLHLAAHHWPTPDLLWLYDVRQIAAALSPDASRRFVDLAKAHGFASVARAVFEETRRLFPGAAIDRLLAALPPPNPREPALALLKHPKRAVDDLILDLRNASWPDRVRLVSEHLWPDADYMRASSGDAPLPIAYLRRVARGTRRWLTLNR